MAKSKGEISSSELVNQENESNASIQPSLLREVLVRMLPTAMLSTAFWGAIIGTGIGSFPIGTVIGAVVGALLGVVPVITMYYANDLLSFIGEKIPFMRPVTEFLSKRSLNFDNNLLAQQVNSASGNIEIEHGRGITFGTLFNGIAAINTYIANNILTLPWKFARFTSNLFFNFEDTPDAKLIDSGSGTPKDEVKTIPNTFKNFTSVQADKSNPVQYVELQTNTINDSSNTANIQTSLSGFISTIDLFGLFKPVNPIKTNTEVTSDVDVALEEIKHSNQP